MIKGNYFTDNENIVFQFNNGIKWEDFTAFNEHEFKDAGKDDPRFEMAPSNQEEAVNWYRTVLETVGDLAGNHLNPNNKSISHEGLKLENGKVIFPEQMVADMNKIIEAGVMPYAMKREYHGLQMPFIAQAIYLELVAAANPTLGLTVGCYNLAEVIEAFGSQELKDEWVSKMSLGEFIGAMALTEPDYGSNLPEVQTRAVQDENGNWKITGNKIFITHGCGFGDQEAVILTLARSSEKAGARGLSFFVVRTRDIDVVRIEEKLGIHCSPTCQISFDNSPAQLIGEEGKGLVEYSMAMMNGARLAIAAQSLGISQGAYNEAVKYANERVQFGKLIKEIPAVQRLLKRMEMELYAQRALLYESAYFVDMLRGIEESLTEQGKTSKEIKGDENFRFVDKMAKLMTPLVKFYNSEKCNTVAYDALQVFGGSGYTEEYDVANYYRDARIASIYEGTSQLQVVAAIGGIVTGLSSDKGIFNQYLEKLKKETPGLPAAVAEAQNEIAAMVAVYKEKERDEKEELSWELVEVSSSLVCSILLYRIAGKDGAPENYKRIADDYSREFLARLAASKVRLAA